jgi:peptidoglycan/xylan/chitin deacetylase (PgdA/CDA1 family)
MQRLVNAITKRIPRHALSRAEEKVIGLRAFEKLEIPRPSAFTVTCDDGELRDLEIAELLESVGLRGVFAISPDLVGRPGFLSFDQILQLHRAGHEIAFHGTTHDAFTEFADEARLVESCRTGVQRLADAGVAAPKTLIYPFGSHNRTVRRAVEPLFTCAFTTWFGLNQGHANRYAIRRIPYGAYTGGLPATESWYRSLIDKCAEKPSWPTLMLHPGSPEHRAEHTAMLGRLLRHAIDRGLAVRTVVAHLGH